VQPFEQTTIDCDFARYKIFLIENMLLDLSANSLGMICDIGHVSYADEDELENFLRIPSLEDMIILQ
jgi:hypothetical protein